MAYRRRGRRMMRRGFRSRFRLRRRGRAGRLRKRIGWRM